MIRSLAASALVLALTATAPAAFAQAEGDAASTTPVAEPAPQIAPSRCPDFSDPPAIPNGATAPIEEVQAALDAFNSWATQYNTTLTCRREELRELRATFEARNAETQAAAAEAQAARTAIQDAQAAAQARQEEEPPRRGRRNR